MESSIFGYTHAFTVVLCYVGVLAVIAITIASVYYTIRHDPPVPQPTMFHATSTAIMWAAMAFTEPCLFAYIGAFTLDGLLQMVLFLLFRPWLLVKVLFSGIIFAVSATYGWRLSRVQGNASSFVLPFIADSTTGRDQNNTWSTFKEFILPCLRPNRKASHTSTESLRLHETVISFNQIPSQSTRYEQNVKAIIESYLGLTRFSAIQCFLQDLISDQSLVLSCAFVIWHIVYHSSSVGSSQSTKED